MTPVKYDLPLAYKGEDYGPIILYPKDENGNYLNLNGRDVIVNVKNKKNCTEILSWSTQYNTVEIRDLIIDAEESIIGAELVLKKVDGSKMQMPCGSYSYEIKIVSGNCFSTYFKGKLNVAEKITQTPDCQPTPTPGPTVTPCPGGICPTLTPPPTPGPTPLPTPAPTNPPPPTPFYIFYAAISREGAEDDFVFHTYDSTTFRYNSGSGTQTESFTQYINRRISSLDRITPYYYNPFSNENKDIIYDLTWLQKPGQTSNNILAFFLIPAAYGSLLEVTDDNIVVSVIPENGRFENLQGYFYIDGVIYKLYQAWGPQTENVTTSTKLHKFIN
jgi:hypothetical protein